MGSPQGGGLRYLPPSLGCGQLLLLQRGYRAQRVNADHSFEAPDISGVQFHDLVIVSLGGEETINHIINEIGGPVNATAQTARLVSYPYWVESTEA